MCNEDSTSSNITAAAATAKPPLLLSMPFDYDMSGPPELNTSSVLYPRNITSVPTWEIAVKVRENAVFIF